MSQTPYIKNRRYAAKLARQKRERFQLYLLLGVGIAAIVGIALWLGFLSSPKSRAPLHPRTMAIATQFRCPCGNCELVLSKCSHENCSAIEELRFISDQLASGANDAQVVEQVRETYGQLIEK
jgi:hypothetical protein